MSDPAHGPGPLPDDPLTPARLTELQQAFEQALERPPGERAGFLASLAEGDARLVEAVRSLLAAHESTGSALQSPVSADALRSLAPDVDPLVGSRVGPYEISRLVGAGGMGTVYEATRADDQYRTRVAIKVLSRHATSESTVQRFRRERQILADLHHPHIASLLDGGVTSDGQPWFAMQYVDGEPLTRWCDARRVPIARRLELLQQVCGAVQYAHENLVIHRDLKPGNIMVTTDGAVKLLDFGIAKLMPEGAAGHPGDLPVTRVGARAYTPDYASPEQLTGMPVGTRADVYALGVVLYELLAGRRPFDLRGRSAADIERTVRDVEPQRPSAAMVPGRAAALAERTDERARQRIEGDLDAITLKALRKEPERRYASPDEMAADLRNYLTGRPVEARPESTVYRVGKLIRRRRAEAAAIALAVLAVVAGLVGVTLQARAAERERDRAAEVTSFLTTMLGAASPESFGRDVRVREVLDSAAVRADRLSGRPAFEAEVRGIIGGTYLALGEFQVAEAQFRRALDALGRAEPAGGRATATMLSRLSMAREFQGHYAAADTVLRTATALFDRHGYASDRAHIDHLDARGRILARLGAMADAEPFFARAVELQRRIVPPDDSSLANLYANLGLVTSELGRNAAAETLFIEAVTAAKRAHGEVHPLVAAILSPLASVQERAGRYPQADSTFRAAIAMRRTLLGEEHPDYAWTMFNYADHLLLVKRYPEAAEWSRRVLALRGRSLQDAHPAVATAMSILGRALGRMDSLAAGERWLRESLALRKSVLPPGHFLVPSAESILGEHLVLARRFGEAEPLLLGSERLLVASRGETAPIVQDARGRIVRLYEAWGKPDEAARWKSRLQPGMTPR